MAAKVEVRGFVGKAPTVNYTASGKPVANVTVAVTHRIRDESVPEGYRDGETTWYKGTFWDADATEVAAGVKKGDEVYLIGNIERAETYTKADGTTGVNIVVGRAEVSVVVRGRKQAQGQPQQGIPAQQGQFAGGNPSPFDQSQQAFAQQVPQQAYAQPQVAQQAYAQPQVAQQVPQQAYAQPQVAQQAPQQAYAQPQVAQQAPQLAQVVAQPVATDAPPF